MVGRALDVARSKSWLLVESVMNQQNSTANTSFRQFIMLILCFSPELSAHVVIMALGMLWYSKLEVRGRSAGDL